MQLLGSRSLAWALRLITEVTLIVWLLLLAYVLVIMVRQRTSEEPGKRQGTIYLELELPTEMVQPASPDITVYNFETNRSRIHYQTNEKSGALDLVFALGMVVIGWGIFAFILWNLRQILASMVAKQPLTLANARRFRTISLLMVFQAAFSALSRSLEYLDLQPLFPLIPPRGFFGLYLEHFDKTDLFTALVILLMAEVLRLGAEHRVDSEAVI